MKIDKVFIDLVFLILFLTIACTEESNIDKIENTAPIIENQWFTISENSTNGTLVGKIIASDSEQDILIFSLLSANNDDTFFLDSISGNLSVLNSSALDFELNSEFQLSIEVSDGKLSDIGIVTINLTDIEESRIYSEPFFDSYIKTQDIIYGINSQAHVMNIYEPDNDSRTNRALVLLLSGGGFYNIDLSTLEPLALKLVEYGIVVGTVEYRVGDGAPEPGVDYLSRLVNAQQDSKAAVRYMRKDAQKWNIDPDFVIIGGWSAGAIASLFHTYVKPENINGSDYEGLINSLGGLEGNQGNENQSSSVQGVISLAGSLFTADEIIKVGDAPIFAVHGTNDEQVPVGIKLSPDGTPQFGSEPLVAHAQSVNIHAEDFIIENGDHYTPVNNPDLYISKLINFLKFIEFE